MLIRCLAVFTLLFSASFGTGIGHAQSSLSRNEVSLNGFRNPSIGLEYRLNHFSLHAGYYTTAFESGVFTNFIKAGVTAWFLPVGSGGNPSSFYGTLAYARGLTRSYEGKNAGVAETGFRFIIWHGLNARLGIAALVAKGESLKINPTPGLSYSFFWE